MALSYEDENFHSMPSKLFNKHIDNYNYEEQNEIAYEDDYCLLTEKQLKIKNYYFPSFKSKLINVRNIKIVYFEEQNNSNYAQRRYGV